MKKPIFQLSRYEPKRGEHPTLHFCGASIRIYHAYCGLYGNPGKLLHTTERRRVTCALCKTRLKRERGR